MQEPADRSYGCSLCVNVQKRGSRRRQWIYIDKTRFHGDEFMLPTAAQVATCCVGDIVEVPVNIANSFGVVAPESLAWRAPQPAQKAREEDPPLFSQSMYDDWTPMATFLKTSTEKVVPFDLAPLFQTMRTACLGLDVAVLKQEVQAVAAGVCEKHQHEFGTQAMIKQPKDAIVVPLRRLGLTRDRHTPMQYRVGDSLTVYCSVGGIRT